MTAFRITTQIMKSEDFIRDTEKQLKDNGLILKLIFTNTLMLKLNGAAHFCRTLRDYLSLSGQIPVSHFRSAGLRSLFVMSDV